MPLGSPENLSQHFSPSFLSLICIHEAWSAIQTIAREWCEKRSHVSSFDKQQHKAHLKGGRRTNMLCVKQNHSRKIRDCMFDALWVLIYIYLYTIEVWGTLWAKGGFHSSHISNGAKSVFNLERKKIAAEGRKRFMNSIMHVIEISRVAFEEIKNPSWIELRRESIWKFI